MARPGLQTFLEDGATFPTPMTPWRHFVPVQEDLSDVLQQAQWVMSHPHAAARIVRPRRECEAPLAIERGREQQGRSRAIAHLERGDESKHELKANNRTRARVCCGEKLHAAVKRSRSLSVPKKVSFGGGC